MHPIDLVQRIASNCSKAIHNCLLHKLEYENTQHTKCAECPHCTIFSLFFCALLSKFLVFWISVGVFMLLRFGDAFCSLFTWTNTANTHSWRSHSTYSYSAAIGCGFIVAEHSIFLRHRGGSNYKAIAYLHAIYMVLYNNSSKSFCVIWVFAEMLLHRIGVTDWTRHINQMGLVWRQF